MIAEEREQHLHRMELKRLERDAVIGLGKSLGAGIAWAGFWIALALIFCTATIVELLP